MAYRFEDDTDKNIGELHAKAGLAIRLMLDDIHRQSTPKTPMLTGQLRADVKKSVVGLHGEITWGKFYAYWQERGYTSGKVRKYTTQGTQAHFAEESVMDVVKDGAKYFERVSL